VSPVSVECAGPPFAGSYSVEKSSFVRLLLLTPSISTNSDVVPREFVTLHAGPGAIHPGGVGPGVSHRFASPPATGGLVPGENLLPVNDADPVWLSVISVTRTIRGVQGTFVFHENGVIGAETLKPGAPNGISAKLERARIATPIGRAAALVFKRIPQCLTLSRSLGRI